MANIERSIAFNRRIAQSCDHIDCGVDELILPGNYRVIHFHNRPDQFEQHKMLTETGVATLDLLYPDDADYNDFSILVPGGTVTLKDQLKSIARDVDDYAEVFYLIGAYLHGLVDKCGVVPVSTKEVGILESLIAMPSDADDQGISIVLSPPYSLGRDVSSPIGKEIRTELENCGFFDSEQIKVLMQAYKWGIQAGEWR